MRLMESAENYLETIYVLKRELGEVRAVDIANHLGFSKPSISTAMKMLRENGYITVSNSKYIALTKEGLDVALKIHEMHRTLANFFISLGVNEKTALEDACKIEHYISDETFDKLRAHLKTE
ncbi:MAG: metal-dependent transcriptional regulator [Clostridiales bacterium]|nr:metal-dependent transcriptional regulator [Clostridiales bacterium]